MLLSIFSCPSSAGGSSELCTERGLNHGQVLPGSSQMPFPEVEPSLPGAGLVPLAEPCRAAGVLGSGECCAWHDALQGTCSSCAFLSLLLVASVKGTQHLLCLQCRELPSQSPRSRGCKVRPGGGCGYWGKTRRFLGSAGHFCLELQNGAEH